MTSSNILKCLKCCLVCGMVTALDSRGPGQVAGLQTHLRDTHFPSKRARLRGGSGLELPPPQTPCWRGWTLAVGKRREATARPCRASCGQLHLQEAFRRGEEAERQIWATLEIPARFT